MGIFFQVCSFVFFLNWLFYILFVIFFYIKLADIVFLCRHYIQLKHALFSSSEKSRYFCQHGAFTTPVQDRIEQSFGFYWGKTWIK